MLRHRKLAALVFLVALSCLPGAAQQKRHGPAAAGPAPTFVYVTNSTSNDISAYAINATNGALTPVPGSPFKAGKTPGGIAVHPSGRFVYVANALSSNIAAYSIDPKTGALTAVAGPPFKAGYGVGDLAIDPAGRFLYGSCVGDYGKASTIYAYTIDASSGALTPVPGSPFKTEDVPEALAVHPSGKFLYVANRANGVAGYGIDAATGALTPLARLPSKFRNPFGLALDPAGRFLYVPDRDRRANNVSAYAIDAASGALKPVAGSPFAAGNGPGKVAIDPSGKFLYATNSFSNDISAYTINPTSGALTPVSGGPFATGAATGAWPWGMAFEPSGRFLYVVNGSKSNNVSAYAINAASGALTPVAGAPFAAGTNPTEIAVTPSRPAPKRSGGAGPRT